MKNKYKIFFILYYISWLFIYKVKLQGFIILWNLKNYGLNINV